MLYCFDFHPEYRGFWYIELGIQRSDKICIFVNISPTDLNILEKQF